MSNDTMSFAGGGNGLKHFGKLPFPDSIDSPTVLQTFHYEIESRLRHRVLLNNLKQHVGVQHINFGVFRRIQLLVKWKVQLGFLEMAAPA
jgi:hypothetical protein